MGARNMRLLRVRRSAANLCWAMVWAVLLSVQLHPRQPVGRCNAEGAEGRRLRPGLWGGTSEPQGQPSPKAFQRSPFLP